MQKPLWLLLALGVIGACGSRPPSDWVARIEAMEGTVQVAAAPAAAVEPAKAGQYLRVGGRLETGARSRAVLELRNRGRLTVQPGSVVQFDSDAPERRLKVGLKAGSVIGKASEVQAAELVIGIGARAVHLTSSAAAEITAKEKLEDSTIVVTFGEAQVEGPEGKRKVVVGEAFTIAPPRPPDAGPPRPDAKAAVQAQELVYYFQASGKGRVMIRQPGQKKFVAVRKGEAVRIVPGTEIQLPKGASAVVGTEKGKGTLLSGPAEVKLIEGPKDENGKSAVAFESTGSVMQLSAAGEAGRVGAPFEAEGVKITPRVAYRRTEVRLRKERGRSQVSVIAGEAVLEGKGRKLVLEAGQDAFLQKGAINGPHMPPTAPLEIKAGGGMRVFTASPTLPVSFRWTSAAKGKGALVEVGRSPSMDNPLFSDVIQRAVLTVPQLPRGTTYWRVRRRDAQGNLEEKPLIGKLLMVKDTSHRSLKDRQAPKNVIHESFGNTTVFYQNVLPRFTFKWEAMGSTALYQMKVFREQSLSNPVFTAETRGSELSVPGAKLGEGTYLWYVAGRERDGSLIRTTKSRKLTIRYDNATPDLQIVYPPNGTSVGEAALETKGVTIPGSKVSINGVRAELDETYRFTHSVKLKPGLNLIIYLVNDPRRGTSYYLRQVTRK